MYDKYDIIKEGLPNCDDNNQQFRAVRPGTSIVIMRCPTKHDLRKTMAAMQSAYETGKCVGITNERARLRVLLGLSA